jgi:hypothetical protein
VVVQGEDYTESFSVVSGPTVTYSRATGEFPSGLDIDPDTGILSGTIAEDATVKVYQFTIRATNGTGETRDTSTLSITVQAAGGYVQVKTANGWEDAVVFVKTANGWEEGEVNVKKPTGWGTSFSS